MVAWRETLSTDRHPLSSNIVRGVQKKKRNGLRPMKPNIEQFSATASTMYHADKSRRTVGGYGKSRPLPTRAYRDNGTTPDPVNDNIGWRNTPGRVRRRRGR